jgi:hypothetical protein
VIDFALRFGKTLLAVGLRPDRLVPKVIHGAGDFAEPIHFFGESMVILSQAKRKR